MTSADTTRAAWPYNAETTMPLPDEPGAMTENTVAAMLALIHHAAVGPAVGAFVESIGGDAAAPFPVRLFRVCAERVKYRADPKGRELLRHPDQLIDELQRTGRTAGDCDELAALIAAALSRASLDAAIVTVARSTTGPFAHVLAGYFPARRQADDATRRSWREVIPIDPQEARAAGEWPAGIARVKVWSV